MANFTYEIDEIKNVYPNILVYKILRDGVFSGWRINAVDGYVFYDSSENNVVIDPETGISSPVTYYYRIAYLPATFNFDYFTWVAVRENEVPADNIFGKGDNTEVI